MPSKTIPKRQSPVELLLPAGDPTKLAYAIAYGADAVYLGLAMASLRTPSKGEQFAPQNLKTHIHQTQQAGVKAYVTLNIFASNHDLKRLEAHLEQLADIQPDGLIISDAGVFRLARKLAPNVPVHISTQANTLNSEACALWADLGAERVILAREVPLREMAQMKAALPDLEFECFVHGSLCVAYSGRCVISDYLTDNTKNSNKGMCGNSCRWEFNVVEKNRPEEVYTFEEDKHGSYMLNSRDLCLVRHLHALRDAGMMSFKVEGRTKGIHYVATVGKVYREAIDWMQASPDTPPSEHQLLTWESELSAAANRGFTEGFLYGKPGPDGIYYQSSQSRSTMDFVASADPQGSTLSDPTGEGRCLIQGRNPIQVGDTLTWITPSTTAQETLASAVDDQGLPLTAIKPNQWAWVMPPASLPQTELGWSLVRGPAHELDSATGASSKELSYVG